MPVNVYSDKFRNSDREQGAPGSPSTSSKKTGEVKRRWNIIKKAIFTPLGSKEYPLERRRRSRRNNRQGQSGEVIPEEDKEDWREEEEVDDVAGLSATDDPLYFATPATVEGERDTERKGNGQKE